MAVQCAAKILGVGDPKATYDRFDIQIWRDKLQAELRSSGLPGAIQRLTTELVDGARINELLSEGDTVFRQLREIIIVYECVLLQYGLLSSDLVPADQNLLRQGESKPNTTLQKVAMIKPLRYPKSFWIRGVG